MKAAALAFLVAGVASIGALANDSLSRSGSRKQAPWRGGSSLHGRL